MSHYPIRIFPLLLAIFVLLISAALPLLLSNGV